MDSFYTLGLLANIAQIITFTVFVWVTVTLFMAKKKIEQKMLSLESCEKNGLSKRPIAIAIGIGKDPTESVKNFLADKKWEDIPLIPYFFPGFLQANDYPEAIRKINDLRSQALKLGVSEVLLFYAGPIDLAIFIGASFSDWVPVRVYAFSDAGTYEQRIMLGREPARLGTLTDELIKELEGKL